MGKHTKPDLDPGREYDQVTVSVTVNNEKYTYGVKVPRVMSPEVHVPVAIRQNVAVIMDAVMKDKPWA
jgi:hypothetical protein